MILREKNPNKYLHRLPEINTNTEWSSAANINFVFNACYLSNEKIHTKTIINRMKKVVQLREPAGLAYPNSKGNNVSDKKYKLPLVLVFTELEKTLWYI